MSAAFPVVIAEDEEPARKHLERLVGSEPGLDLVASVSDGVAAIAALDRYRPKALFLDVRMPNASGLEVLRRSTHEPAVVFTTAFDDYAVAAFELGAIDYLLKPFGEDRFRAAAQRLVRSLGPPPPISVASRLEAVWSPSPLRRFFVRVGARLLPIDLADVIRFSAARDHTTIHVEGAEHLVRIGISELELRCDPSSFLRVHRSHLVNLTHVRQVSIDDEGRHVVLLSDGLRVTASRAGARRLRALAL